MAVKLTLTDVDNSSEVIYAYGTLAFSGTYPTGGDTVDLTTLANQVGSAGQTVATSMTTPATGAVNIQFTSQAGSDIIYTYQQGTAANNGKLRGFAATGGVEFTGGSAYPAGALADVVGFAIVFRKI